MSSPPFTCRCGRHHRTWHALASCLWPRAEWIDGNGPLATVSTCPPAVTVQLHGTRTDAEAAMKEIGRLGCGAHCHRWHRLLDLAAGG